MISKSIREKSESKSVEPKPKKVKKLKRPKKTFSGYTEAQHAEYKEHFNWFMEKSAAYLKVVLAANGQSKSGNKS